MRAEADNKFRAKEQELLGRIAEMEQTIEKLQREEQSTGVLLTSKQQQEIDNFRIEMLDLRRELRDVQLSLRKNVETLEREVRLVVAADAKEALHLGELDAHDGIRLVEEVCAGMDRETDGERRRRGNDESSGMESLEINPRGFAFVRAGVTELTRRRRHGAQHHPHRHREREHIVGPHRVRVHLGASVRAARYRVG